MELDNADWWKGGGGLPALAERSEKLVLKTVINKSVFDAARGNYLIKKLGVSEGEYNLGDYCEGKYTLNINYFGDCIEMINAFLELRQAGAVIECNTEELNYGYCMIQKLFESIAALKNKGD